LLSINASKHTEEPSSHDFNYEDCDCDNSGDVMNCDNDSYTFHHIHHDKAYGNSSVPPATAEDSIPPIGSTKVFNLTLYFGSRLLENEQYLMELSHMCRRINDLHLITNSHPVLVIDIESYEDNAIAEDLSKVIPTPRQLAVLKMMDDQQLFRLLGSGGYYSGREKADRANHLYDASTDKCLLYTNLVGMRSTTVIEINQVRVGMRDLTSQTKSYLHEDKDRHILLVDAIRHQAKTLRVEENVHVVVLIIFADFATSSSLARHTKEQVSLVMSIHDGDEVANCHGKFYHVDSERVVQVPFSSINYSRDDIDSRMAIGNVAIVGRKRSYSLHHEIEFSIRSGMMLDIGRYRVGWMTLASAFSHQCR